MDCSCQYKGHCDSCKLFCYGYNVFNNLTPFDSIATYNSCIIPPNVKPSGACNYSKLDLNPKNMEMCEFYKKINEIYEKFELSLRNTSADFYDRTEELFKLLKTQNEDDTDIFEHYFITKFNNYRPKFKFNNIEFCFFDESEFNAKYGDCRAINFDKINNVIDLDSAKKHQQCEVVDEYDHYAFKSLEDAIDGMINDVLCASTSKYQLIGHFTNTKNALTIYKLLKNINSNFVIFFFNKICKEIEKGCYEIGFDIIPGNSEIGFNMILENCSSCDEFMITNIYLKQ